MECFQRIFDWVDEKFLPKSPKKSEIQFPIICNVPSHTETKSHSEIDTNVRQSYQKSAYNDYGSLERADGGYEQSESEPEPRKNIDYFFAGADETDYTRGPAKMVVVNDLEKGCAAILLSMELSDKIQNMLLHDRNLIALEAHAQRRYAELDDQEHDFFATVTRKSMEMSDIREKAAWEGRELTEQESAQLENSKQSHDEAQVERSRAKEERKALQRRLQNERQYRQRLQWEVNRILENVFVNCYLIPAPEGVSQHAQLPFEYGTAPNFRAPPSSIDGYGIIRDPSDDGHKLDNPEKQAVWDDLCQKQEQLRQAQGEFDAHKSFYDRDLHAYIHAQVNRPNIDCKAEFDLIHLQRGRGLTRNLIEAEEAYETAEISAKNVGIPHHNFQEANFVDRSDDGYLESGEQEAMDFVDRRRIERWLEDVGFQRKDGIKDFKADEPHTYQDEPDVYDDARDINSKKPFYSVSVVAYGTERKRIDRWHERIEDLRWRPY